MTYHVGIGFGMRALGMEPRDPHLSCDGCGATRPVARPGGMAFAWFLDGKKAPGWSMDREGETRRDWCGPCTKLRGEVRP